MTYDELVTNIRNYTEVDSNVLTSSVINTFITLAENRIMREVDLDVFKEYVTGNFTTSNAFLEMPSDFLFARYVQIIDGNNDRTYLEPREMTFINEYIPDRTTTGTPKYYAMFDQNTMIVAPAPSSAINVELGYFRRATQLSSGNSPTWLSTNAPEVLLYACLVEAYSYLKGPADLLAYFENSYKRAVQGLGIEQQGRSRRDEFRDGMIRIKLKSESPGP